MPPPRMALAELAPITQRSASSRLDLPQPLGPTTPVRPGSMRKSAAATNDLNPVRRSLEKCTAFGFRPSLSTWGGGDRGAQLRDALFALQLALADHEGRGAG